MKQERAERIGDAMRAELGQMLQRDVKDPRIGMASVIRVEVARDLAVARVYVSVLDADQAAETLAGLASAASFLRGEVARRLGLRQAPALEFRLDRSVDASLTVQRLLREVAPDPAEDKSGE